MTEFEELFEDPTPFRCAMTVIRAFGINVDNESVLFQILKVFETPLNK